MPKSRAIATRRLYRALLLTSGFGILSGLFALDRHPLLGSTILITAVTGSLLALAGLVPARSKDANPFKEIDHGGRRHR